MSSENKGGPWGIIFGVSTAFLCVVLWAKDDRLEQVKQEAIERGHAKYSATKEWHWIDDTTAEAND